MDIPRMYRAANWVVTCAIGIALAGPTQTAAASQEGSVLPVRVVAENTWGEGLDYFTAESLAGNVALLLTRKLEQVRIDSTSDLWLYVAPTCLLLSNGAGYACAINASLRLNLGQFGGFSQLQHGVLWNNGALLVGPDPEGAEPRILRWLDSVLGEPLGVWLELSDDAKRCWTLAATDPIALAPWAYDRSSLVAKLLPPGALQAQFELGWAAALTQGPCPRGVSAPLPKR